LAFEQKKQVFIRKKIILIVLEDSRSVQIQNEHVNYKKASVKTLALFRKKTI
jgi:hypothetical protein